MKLFVSSLLVVLLAGIAFAESPEFKSEKEKLSYSMGVATGTQLKRQSVDVDTDMFTKGMKDVISGAPLMMTEQEVQDTLMKFQKDLTAKQAEKAKEAGEKNKKEGEAFLAGNNKKEGVKTLPSGLQYKVIKEGTGKMPKETDTVVTNYKGSLIDGTEFDSSFKRGQPATFPVKGVIKGWTEALQLMKEGSTWQLFVPSDLAYGERGAGSVIGPNATLIFEVELISIKAESENKEAPAKPAAKKPESKKTEPKK
jgi:FKBP-type peptidyl-prolyl cis-trans isomerase FklB